ncbi:hypothetical protein MBRA1_001756 [Malassezia brasiliensis]|uniref:Deacetylase sirtuin-type domain-containing protein n=1 Tax=Malassezia brasiliensis TaxID=1821822 RepID=A0AAF0DS86_9BASI|nr:hypothetical protein MBRA1_001756 [Malassezia brasiliensis]
MPSYARVSASLEHDLGRVYLATRQARRIAVVCGAGISVSSPANIPDFRSASGLFTKLKERYPDAGLSSGKDLFDARLFNSERSTALFYTMMAELKDMADAAQPTAFHQLLKRLDEEGRLQRVYTQNIDGLEAKAGLSFGFEPDAPGPEPSGSKRRRTAFARSQSDSVLVHGASQNKPLFPRAIPLHGSLSTLSCALCSYTLSLAHDTQPAKHALSRMREGQPVWCTQCEAADELRVAAGLRSRGIGRMKVDVVLYNGENDTAERVGACVERDLLGLRDPNEPQVPETPGEARARQRRERSFAQRTHSLAAPPIKKEVQPPADGLSVQPNAKSADAVLDAFFDDERPVEEAAPPAPVPKPSRARLKPLPPDLLIVAGTSLKVPGTKRIVREFAKACRARDAPRDAARADAPIRTIYLNYDFPAAAREWCGTFDVWIQGDVQASARGLGSVPGAPESAAWAAHAAAATAPASVPDAGGRDTTAKPSRTSRSAPAARGASRGAHAPLGFVSGKLSTAIRRGKA